MINFRVGLISKGSIFSNNRMFLETQQFFIINSNEHALSPAELPRQELQINQSADAREVRRGQGHGRKHAVERLRVPPPARRRLVRGCVRD